MATTITALRDAIRTQLATISGLRAHAEFPDQVATPAAMVRPTEITYHETFRSTIAEIGFEVVLLAAPLGLGVARAQDALDGYLNSSDAKSIKRVLELDGTLGGIAHEVRVLTASEIGGIEYAGGEFAGAKWQVRLTAEL